MPKGLYRSCQACGLYFHPDELIRVPEDVPEKERKRLCLKDAEKLLKGIIAREECRILKTNRWRAA